MRKLIIVDDEGRRTTVPLVRSEITIGREEGNTIRLTERNVSRHHARIFKNGDGYLVEDSSRYGTRKNGVRIDGTEPFLEGDVMIIGSYRVELIEELVDTPAAQPPPDLEEVRVGTEDLRAVTDGAPALRPSFSSIDAESSARARLVCMSDPFVGSEFALTNDQMTIGTAGDCDLIIGHRSVAPHHATFTLRDDGYELDPVEAGYPVAVNGRYNPHGPLRAGDEVLLGELKFRFALPGEDIPFVPLDDIEDEAAVTQRPVWMLAAIAGVMLIVMVLLLVAVTSRRPDTPAPTPETSAAAPGTPTTAAPTAASSAALETGRAHLDGARWAEALRAFESVPEDDPAHGTAIELAARAQAEAENRDKYDAAVRTFDAGDYEGALAALETIPDESYYGVRAVEEDVIGRTVRALIASRIAASRVAQDDGDLVEARRLVTDLTERAPEDPDLQARLTEIDAAEEAAREAAREQAAREAQQEAHSSRTASSGSSSTADEPRSATRTTATVDEPTEMTRSERRSRAAELRGEAARAGVQQNFQEAIRLLEQARELDPGDAQINLMLFSNYRQIGNRSRAAAAVRRYLRQRPDDPRREQYEAWLTENAPD